MSPTPRIRWSRIVAAVVVVLAVPFVTIGFVAVGVLGLEVAAQSSGIFTRNALRAVRSAPSQGGRSLDAVVAARYRGATWSSYHRDSINDVYVVCEALHTDGTSAKLKWFVKGRITWRNGFHVKTVAVSAINSEAYVLAPQLLEPGRPVFGSADFAY